VTRQTERDYALLWLRLAAGGITFALHGMGRLSKLYHHFVLGEPWPFIALVQRIGFPLPTLFAVASSLAESVCALMIVTGLCTRWAALALVINMGVATGFELSKGGSGAELPAMYLLAHIGVAIAGSGRYSLDEWLSRRKKTSVVAVPASSV
jgi:putative oxidoreductase